MSKYHNECPYCGDEYITYSWEPSECPLCQVDELKTQLKEARKVATEYRDAYGKHFKDGYSDIASLPWEQNGES